MTISGYRLTAAAARDADVIYFEGLTRFGMQQADQYHDGLFATFEFLADYPKAARLRRELPGNVRVYRYRSHVIVYRTQDDGSILIVRVQHGRQDWQSEITH